MKITPYTPQNRQNQPNFKAGHLFTTKGAEATSRVAELYDRMKYDPTTLKRTCKLHMEPETDTLMGKFLIFFENVKYGDQPSAEETYMDEFSHKIVPAINGLNKPRENLREDTYHCTSPYFMDSMVELVDNSFKPN